MAGTGGVGGARELLTDVSTKEGGLETPGNKKVSLTDVVVKSDSGLLRLLASFLSHPSLES